MPRIKSAIKRVQVTERNRKRNIAFKSAMRTAMKKAFQLAGKGDEAASKAALNQAYSLLDRGVLKGTIHKNTAARYKSRIAKTLNREHVA